MGATPATEMQAVSGRTVHRGPPVRPGGTGEPEQVRLYTVYIIHMARFHQFDLVCEHVLNKKMS